LDELRAFLRRRAPGAGELTTARSEADEPEVLSGLYNGATCGAPLAIVIKNADARPADYEATRDVPRPSHADYPARVKFNNRHDASGGGHFSGRLTTPLCAAGGICLQLLREINIFVGAHILRVGSASDDPFDPVRVSEKDFCAVKINPLPVLNREAGEAMRVLIAKAKEDGDSVGGVIECAAVGLPAGLGDPMFDGIENRVAQIVFGIPGVKGIEFGSGFAGAAARGSINNDAFYFDGGEVRTRTNNCGGILGGMTDGMPVIFRAAFKPTPSIAAGQESVDLSNSTNTSLHIKGRHDPCIVLRAAPCVEAAAAIALYDAYLCR